VAAHLPDDYVTEQAARLEAYRRLAAATTQEAVDDVVAEWEDRYGPLPPRARSLIDVARLRVEALRVGLTEIVALRREVKLAPVDLSPSQEVRLERLTRRRGVLNASERTVFIPVPEGEPATAIAAFIRSMWPSEGS
jgi:transcription-repair coupling factor (superfamily II helicase)